MNANIETFLQSILTAVKTLSDKNRDGELNGSAGDAILRDLRRIDNELDELVGHFED